MDVEVSDEMVEAIAQLFDSDAWHPNLRKDGLGVYWHSRRARAREKAKATIPLIASQVEAATIERCAKVAEEAAAKAVTNSRDVDVITQSVAAVDTAESIAAAIRSLSEGEKG